LFVRVGPATFPAGTVEWVPSTRTVFDAYGEPATRVQRLELRGDIQGTGVKDVAAKCGQLRAIYNRQFVDLALLDDDGTILESLVNATSLTGVRLLELTFPDARGGQFTTYRSFVLVAEASYPASAGTIIVEWTQTVSKRGGGPMFSFLRCKKGPAVRILENEQTEYTATQRGVAAGLLPNPQPPRPLWPGALIPALTEIEYDDPVFVDGRNVWRVSWSYVFGSESPLR
jgi:hypothetical protein